MIWATNLCFDERIPEDGQGDEKNGRENCTSSRENVVPNNNVIVNPYQKNANTGRVEHTATVKNPYKKTGPTNGTQVHVRKQIMANNKVRGNK